MSLPNEIVNRILNTREVVGLLFMVNNRETVFPLRVTAVEYPNILWDFTLGSAASALNNTGTTWSNVQDSSNVYLLRPSTENQAWQFFYGINPGYAWIYRAYPANQTRGGLSSPISVGATTNATGYITGRESPYLSPSPVTEFWTTYGISPAFIGYHPYAAPSSITVRMNFYGIRYRIAYEPTATPKRVITMGGDPPIDAPQWLTQAANGRAN